MAATELTNNLCRLSSGPAKAASARERVPHPSGVLAVALVFPCVVSDWGLKNDTRAHPNKGSGTVAH